jgi:sugar phosphate isomerase/epimerase
MTKEKYRTEITSGMSQPIHLLCSTGAFSRYPDYTGYKAVLQYGPALEVHGFELMVYPSWYPEIEQIGTALKQSGLSFPAMHGEKSIGTLLGQPDPDERQQGIARLIDNFRLGRLLGTRLLVLHLWNWPELDDNLDNNLSVLQQCYDEATRYEIELAIETIPGRHYDPLTNIRRALTQDVRSHFALDTEFLANYQQLNTIFQTPWLWQDDRIHHVHIKDSNGNPFVNGQRVYLHPGAGNIDFATFFQHLRATGFHGNLSLESPAITDDGQVLIQQLNASLNFIRQFVW